LLQYQLVAQLMAMRQQPETLSPPAQLILPAGLGLENRDAQSVSITSTPFSIGRLGNCNVTIPDDAVSGQHATLLYDNERYFLRDDGSRNGTFCVRGNQRYRVQPNERYPLQFGDTIQLGNRIQIGFREDK
jgi:pSer/pThr/pTyr-binding forkhead associated (FHA) protein